MIKVDGGQIRSVPDLQAHLLRELDARRDPPRLREQSRTSRVKVDLKAEPDRLRPDHAGARCSAGTPAT